MVSDDLLQKLNAIQEGQVERKPSDALLIAEALKQLAQEDEDIKEEIEDIDLTVIQFVVTDADYKYWLKFGEGQVDYGEGETDNPSATMKASTAAWAGMASGEVDGTSAYMSGDLQIEGNLQDAITYGEITGMVMEAISELRD
ncbi:MAG: SCP2 sterol-binding domain-containing protein [Candidatus Odinarchaeota archaeon]